MSHGQLHKYVNYCSFKLSDSGKCYVWGLVPWAAKTFSDPLELDLQECVHVQATNLFAAVITSVSKQFAIIQTTP
jgi:hypothetical protein